MARKRYQQGSVYLDGDQWKGRYREDVIVDGNIKRTRHEVILGARTAITKPIAKRRLEVFLAPINSIAYRPGRMATFTEFIERWKAEVLVHWKPSAIRSARSHLKCYIVPQLGPLRMEDFGVENQQMFVTRVRKNGVSRKTIQNVLATLSSILTKARDWGYTCIPIDASKLDLGQRSVTEEQPHFTLDQIRRILAIADEPWHTLFALLAMTGLRAGEALGLQVGDIDFSHQTITIRRSAWYGKAQTPKTRGSETVLTLPAPLAVILKNHLATISTKPDTFLFVTKNNRPPSSNKVVEYRLWAILDALNIPRCGLHAFRHGVATLITDMGYSPEVAQKQLRHADVKTTLKYIHVPNSGAASAMAEVAAKLDANGRQGGPVN